MAELQELTRTNDVNALRSWLEETGALDIADELARLDPEDRAIPFRLLAKDRALEVFELLDPIHQQELLESLREERVRELVESMEPDDRVRLLDEMPAKVANRLRAGLSSDERQLTAILLGYPPESAGRMMTPEYVNLRASMSVADALAKVRRSGEAAETIYLLPVTDDQRKLLGVISLRDLVLADSARRVGDLMRTEVHSVDVDADQEEVARLIQEADVLVVPVVDHEDRLVGVVTVDDAMEVFEREVTEDVSRAGGVEPLERPYLSVGPFHLARKRAVWLLFLGIAAALTVNVLTAFEATLEQISTLAVFIPLLIDTGGNSGAQASTVVIRAMAVDEIRFRDLPRVVSRELLVGVMLGAMLGALAFPLVTLFFGAEFGVIIASTLFVIVIWATFAGAALPMLAKRLGLDPAVLSAPIITTLVDATGLLIYLGIAITVLADQLTLAALSPFGL
ncbi:magnesium transporter [Egibacter rhizosphaerae]|uniref:Magnesium transporter MgtE n=1 Tax=Egibacter rhizosphaerae TaxID=1670831 RepID=A0A411YJK8_9ACTN|nr:magnesium transporter [Egibacter rhizosphaerae]QBI21339.1 magnesium transporter [Egibacter rhizosphaerae]